MANKKLIKEKLDYIDERVREATPFIILRKIIGDSEHADDDSFERMMKKK